MSIFNNPVLDAFAHNIQYDYRTPLQGAHGHTPRPVTQGDFDRICDENPQFLTHYFTRKQPAFNRLCNENVLPLALHLGSHQVNFSIVCNNAPFYLSEYLAETPSAVHDFLKAHPKFLDGHLSSNSGVVYEYIKNNPSFVAHHADAFLKWIDTHPDYFQAVVRRQPQFIYRYLDACGLAPTTAVKPSRLSRDDVTPGHVNLLRPVLSDFEPMYNDLSTDPWRRNALYRPQPIGAGPRPLPPRGNTPPTLYRYNNSFPPTTPYWELLRGPPYSPLSERPRSRDNEAGPDEPEVAPEEEAQEEEAQEEEAQEEEAQGEEVQREEAQGEEAQEGLEGQADEESSEEEEFQGFSNESKQLEEKGDDGGSDESSSDRDTTTSEYDESSSSNDDDEEDDDRGGNQVRREEPKWEPEPGGDAGLGGEVGSTTPSRPLQPRSSSAPSDARTQSSSSLKSIRNPTKQSRALKISSQANSIGSWSNDEDTECIRHMLNIRAEGKLSGEKRFDEASKRLTAGGINRSFIAVKNRWNRGLRERSGFDERKNKSQPLTTSKQDKRTKEENAKKRQEAIVKGKKVREYKRTAVEMREEGSDDEGLEEKEEVRRPTKRSKIYDDDEGWEEKEEVRRPTKRSKIYDDDEGWEEKEEVRRPTKRSKIYDGDGDDDYVY